MNTPTSRNPMLFCDYYKQWINVYKEGAIRPVTMSKYNMAHQWLLKLAPDLSISELDRISYQKILNEYAEEHEHQTTMDFHHHVKCAILDAVDEGLIPRDPTRKAIIKGKKPREKKQKLKTLIWDRKYHGIGSSFWLPKPECGFPKRLH